MFRRAARSYILAPFSVVVLLGVPLLAATALHADVSVADRVIDITQRVGAITMSSTADQLKKFYGRPNVVPSGDGLSAVLFPGTPDEVRVEFKTPGKSVSRVLIGGVGGAWATANGLHVGTSMEDLEKINGGPFDITGVNWTEPARVVSWKGGNLPAQLYVDLGPQGEMDEATKRSLRSRQTFYDSQSRVFRDFFVRRIVIEW